MQTVLDIALSSWLVLGQMAPYLILGFLTAGALSVFVSPEWVERHLGGSGLSPVLKSAVLGVPLPLCSCGVIPVAASIRSHGASRGATAGFLLSTPQTGVDSIFATYALLGPVFAVFRPLAALATGVIGGMIVSAVESDDNDEPRPAAACCSDGCGHMGGEGNAVVRGLRYGFVTLPRDIGRALLFGVLLAGILSTLVGEDTLAPFLGGGLMAMFIMMAVGIPLFVCATASIPLAVGFMHMGASPGAALVFLIAGPATNAAAISVVWQVLGKRTAIVYLLTVAVAALVSGLALDYLFGHVGIPAGLMPGHEHHETLGWFGHAGAVALLALIAGSYLWGKRTAGSGGEAVEGDAPEQAVVVLNVTGMTCTHCAESVARALRETPGVQSVNVDLDAGRATVTGAGLDCEVLLTAVRGLGYEASIR